MAGSDGGRIGFLLERNGSKPGEPRISPVTGAILKGLREHGMQVDCIVPEDQVWDLGFLRPEHHLYVLKSESALALSLAGALTVAGAEVLNAFYGTHLARDKVAATAVLAAAGIPVPPSYATGTAALLQPLLEESTLWIKPQRGTKGAGVERLVEPGALDPNRQCQDAYGLPLPFFVQQEVPSSGKDLKVYVIGDEAWAIERTFPPLTDEDKQGRPAGLSPAIREAALACGRALHLEIYGVDFLMTDDRFTVIDVNSFPGYKGIREAPAALTRHILRRVREARTGKGGVL